MFYCSVTVKICWRGDSDHHKAQFFMDNTEEIKIRNFQTFNKSQSVHQFA